MQPDAIGLDAHDPQCRWPTVMVRVNGPVDDVEFRGCDCDLIARVRAEERWKIGDALATQEALVADRLMAEWTSYDDGQRDAYDIAEQIACNGGALRAW